MISPILRNENTALLVITERTVDQYTNNRKTITHVYIYTLKFILYGRNIKVWRNREEKNEPGAGAHSYMYIYEHLKFAFTLFDFQLKWFHFVVVVVVYSERRIHFLE